MNAKSADNISYTQGNELLLALEKAGLTGAIAQEVIDSEGNRKAKAMMAALENEAVRDDRFTLVTSFNIVVPKNYDHATRLDSFKRKHGREFYCYNDAITDSNFGKATTQLVPGRKMTVKVFKITRQVTSEGCLSFLKKQNAVLVGAQGASLAYEQGKNQLLKGYWYVSFDEKNALWKDAVGYRRVPYVLANSDGVFEFLLGNFEGLWFVDACLLCFRDSESSDD